MHVAGLYLCAQIIAALEGWTDARNVATKSVTLAHNGAFLDVRVMANVSAFMRDRSVAFTWKAGDVLIVDNRVAMHSREPFEADYPVRGVEGTEKKKCAL